MTFLVERLAELRRYVDHLRTVRARVTSADSLRDDLSLHNDVMFSLLSVCQLIIDISGELSARERLPFDDYTSAVRNLERIQGFPASLVQRLSRLPGFRNVLIHEYIELDLRRVIEALDDLPMIDEFISIVLRLESEG